MEDTQREGLDTNTWMALSAWQNPHKNSDLIRDSGDLVILRILKDYDYETTLICMVYDDDQESWPRH